MTRVLVLGGTTEATRLAAALAENRIETVFSYAGRTETPIAQPVPVRRGGFGGTEGLARYLTDQQITHVVDATHPFAAQISHNAVAACAATNVPLIALQRAPWAAGPGDDWLTVPDIDAAAAALPRSPARVFLAIGRQHLLPFASRPQHFYLLRLVDPLDDLPLPLAHAVIARGPFCEADDRRLMLDHGITHLVAKNSGGEGARAKIDAARTLRLPVILINRPDLPDRPIAATVAQVMDWLHPADLGV